MTQYIANSLAKLAGISVRTLHLYDKRDLVKPGHPHSPRTKGGYRL